MEAIRAGASGLCDARWLDFVCMTLTRSSKPLPSAICLPPLPPLPLPLRDAETQQAQQQLKT